jgi:predicted TIM-barrel fold metal-dependent hydrolase
MGAIVPIFVVLAIAQNPVASGGVPLPRVDHHQHLLSPAATQFMNAIAGRRGQSFRNEEPVDAKQLVAMLDAAGIARAVVLSNAYYFDPIRRGREAYPQVQAENDWTAKEVATFPDRLIAFCSFSPLKDYALEELERCARSGAFKGLKLHFGTSGVDLRNSEHVEKVRRVFAAANSHRLPLIIHVRASPDSGRDHAEIVLTQLLPAAPDVPVQIAHLWGGAEFAEGALAAYADAIVARQPATARLSFDVAQIASVIGRDQGALKRAAAEIRRIGIGRIVYGSDGPTFGNLQPLEAWGAFRKALPLTNDEFTVIANNVALYAR